VAKRLHFSQTQEYFYFVTQLTSEGIEGIASFTENKKYTTERIFTTVRL
jgi:hypothetical protein